MANRRYKTAKELNAMIDKLEQRVMYENINREDVYFKSPTRKSIAGEYGAILDSNGRFISYEKAKEYQESFGFEYTKEQYKHSLQEFQESELYDQITYRGARRYIKNKSLNTLDYQIEMLEDSGEDTKELRRIRKLPLQELLRLIDSAGYRVAEEKKEYQNSARNYDSNTFYDYLIEEYQSQYSNEDE